MTYSIYVPYSKLPAFEGATGQYKVRFRINSIDRTQTSAWTPYYSVSVLPVTPGEGSVSFPSVDGTDTASVSWTDPNGFGSYDIFTYDIHSGTTATWEYVTTIVDSNSWRSPINVTNPNPNKFGVVVQAPTFPKQIWHSTAEPYKYTIYHYGNVDPPDTL